jgi:tetratricopeptide (TPR) repeat protein
MSYSRNDEIDQEFENSSLNRDYNTMLVPTVCQLITERQYEQALTKINDFHFERAHQDKNNQLKKKCDLWIAQVYEEQGRYDEALSIYDSLSQSPAPEHLWFITRQTDVVRVLHMMKKHEDACSRVEITLDRQTNSTSFDILRLLIQYVDVLEAIKKDFPLKHRTLIEKLVDDLSIRIDGFDLSQSTSICELIRLIHQENRNANKRYARLVIELDAIEDDNEAISILEKYVSEESFEFYRNLAIEELSAIYEDP